MLPPSALAHSREDGTNLGPRVSQSLHRSYKIISNFSAQGLQYSKILSEPDLDVRQYSRLTYRFSHANRQHFPSS